MWSRSFATELTQRWRRDRVARQRFARRRSISYGARRPFADAIAHALFGRVRDELARSKRAAGRYDFDDMLSLVDDALHGPRGDALAQAMRQKWRYALIDEFQDTDQTQWSIFRRAFFEREAGAPRTVLVLVGDPKQSIYRFRGADVCTRHVPGSEGRSRRRGWRERPTREQLSRDAVPGRGDQSALRASFGRLDFHRRHRVRPGRLRPAGYRTLVDGAWARRLADMRRHVCRGVCP